MELTDTFEKAATFIKSKIGELSEPDILDFYGLFKQAKEGPCTSSKPGFLQFTEKAKWAAWQKHNKKSRDCAMTEYIAKVENIYPDWLMQIDEKTTRKGSAWVHHSCLTNDEPELEDSEKTIWDRVRENDVDSLLKALSEHDIGIVDDDGLTLLHWAADRGHLETVVELLRYPNGRSILNVVDGEGQTALHYAAQCGHVEIVVELLKFGAKTEIPDCDGRTPKDVACSDEISRLFV